MHIANGCRADQCILLSECNNTVGRIPLSTSNVLMEESVFFVISQPVDKKKGPSLDSLMLLLLQDHGVFYVEKLSVKVS